MPAQTGQNPPPANPGAHSRPAPNHLAGQTSPYLLQHQFNPVDWHPWGPEAFAEARRRGVPIFLSVGYSTCYWCHVMERESFENPATGDLLNRGFVCIKVDREERPDVDDIYMAAVQAMSGRGGWPMSVWLTPPGARGPDDQGLEPFYAGTYFPPEPRHGMAAFSQVLVGISEAWEGQRGQVLAQAARVSEAVREQLGRASEPVHVGPEQVGEAVGALLRIYDREHAGFGSAPKFPQPVYLEFLMEVLPGVEDPAVGATVRRAIRHTLDRMGTGGLFDQVGGGYHRYSTDERWLVPHFEKMLYDNAQLASLSARWLREGGDPFDALILRRTLDYVLREMASPAGGFFSAQDAEVNHREGQNFLWARAQLVAALGEEDGAFAARVYGVDGGPNFRDPHHPEDQPANVLFLSDRPESVARSLSMDPGAFADRLTRLNGRLLEARSRRDQPHTDDKVLAGWNGLMIAALADGAAALDEPLYADAARKAATFIVEHLRAPDGSLLRSWRDGQPGAPAFLEDYAFLARGLIAIHRAEQSLGLPGSGSIGHAAAIVDRAIALFEDPARPGRLCDTLEGQSDLIVRVAGTYDGAVPSGASVLIHDLLDLHELTGDIRFLHDAARCLAAITPAIKDSPVGSINSTRALYRLLRSDPDALRRAGVPELAPDPNVVRVAEAPVQVFSGAERLTVAHGRPAELTIELRIAEGFHVTAAEPGMEGLVPLSVRIEGGAGVRVSAEFPPGEPYRGEALAPEDQGKLLVYSGVLRATLRLERTEEKWTGTPLIVITYQPCNDNACFQPIKAELDVAIDPG